MFFFVKKRMRFCPNWSMPQNQFHHSLAHGKHGHQSGECPSCFRFVSIPQNLVYPNKHDWQTIIVIVPIKHGHCSWFKDPLSDLSWYWYFQLLGVKIQLYMEKITRDLQGGAPQLCLLVYNPHWLITVIVFLFLFLSLIYLSNNMS